MPLIVDKKLQGHKINKPDHKGQNKKIKIHTPVYNMSGVVWGAGIDDANLLWCLNKELTTRNILGVLLFASNVWTVCETDSDNSA